MKRTDLNCKDPDFEDFTATFNGDLQRHDTIVSASGPLGQLVRRNTNGDGEIIDGETTLTGAVRVVERNEAVRAKEPTPAVAQAGKPAPIPQAAPADEPAPQPAKVVFKSKT